MIPWSPLTYGEWALVVLVLVALPQAAYYLMLLSNLFRHSRYKSDDE